MTDTPMSEKNFWMKVAAGVFGLWALMIPLGIQMMRSMFTESTAASAKLTEKQTEFNVKYEAYVLAQERRTTLLEERQQNVLMAIKDSNARIGELERAQPPPTLKR